MGFQICQLCLLCCSDTAALKHTKCDALCNLFEAEMFEKSPKNKWISVLRKTAHMKMQCMFRYTVYIQLAVLLY